MQRELRLILFTSIQSCIPTQCIQMGERFKEKPVPLLCYVRGHLFLLDAFFWLQWRKVSQNAFDWSTLSDPVTFLSWWASIPEWFCPLSTELEGSVYEENDVNHMLYDLVFTLTVSLRNLVITESRFWSNVFKWRSLPPTPERHRRKDLLEECCSSL